MRCAVCLITQGHSRTNWSLTGFRNRDMESRSLCHRLHGSLCQGEVPTTANLPCCIVEVCDRGTIRLPYITERINILRGNDEIR